jgi:hypothetical protein
MMGKGKELELPEGPEGPEGQGSAKRILMTGVPPKMIKNKLGMEYICRPPLYIPWN